MNSRRIWQPAAPNGRLTLVFGPWIYHYTDNSEHNNAPWLTGLEWDGERVWKYNSALLLKPLPPNPLAKPRLFASAARAAVSVLEAAFPTVGLYDDAATVGKKLRALADELQLDEIVINTWAHDPAVRRTSYSLIAREFGLS